MVDGRGTAFESAFFARDVNRVARGLIGARITLQGVGGIIVETEAYAQDDPACHAYNGPTPRSEVLFGPPGRAYVYFTYGVHHLINVVAEPIGTGAAVLIRALQPVDGIEQMMNRRGRRAVTDLCSGPGKLTQALGIDLSYNRSEFGTEGLLLTRDRPGTPKPEVVTGPRIGISRGRDLMWRYCVRGSEYVSRPRLKD